MLTKPILQRGQRIFAMLLAVGLGLFTSGCSSGSSTPAPATERASLAPTPVSSGAYENKLVRRPGNSAEQGKVYVVQNGKRRWVVNASWFAGHGFKFPDDVHEISVAEFETIPIGDPIQ